MPERGDVLENGVVVEPLPWPDEVELARFDPALHPRDDHGRWRTVIRALGPSDEAFTIHGAHVGFQKFYGLGMRAVGAYDPDGTLVGSAAYDPPELYAWDKPTLKINSVYVTPEHRDSNLVVRLLTSIISQYPGVPVDAHVEEARFLPILKRYNERVAAGVPLAAALDELGEEMLTLAWSPDEAAKHPRDPGGEGGGRFIRKGTSALDDAVKKLIGVVNGWDEDPPWDHPKSDFVAGHVPGFRYSPPRDGYTFAARMGDPRTGDKMIVVTDGAFDRSKGDAGRTTSTLLYHEAGHEVFRHLTGSSIQKGDPTWDALAPWRRDDDRGWTNPFGSSGGYEDNPEEIIAEAYSQLIHGRLESQTTFVPGIDGPPGGEFTAEELAGQEKWRRLFGLVAAAAGDMGLPDHALWSIRADGDDYRTVPFEHPGGAPKPEPYEAIIHSGHDARGAARIRRAGPSGEMWSTTDHTDALDYASGEEGNVLTYRVRLLNPLHVDAPGMGTVGLRRFIDQAKRDGNDGLVVKQDDGSTHVIVLDPSTLHPPTLTQDDVDAAFTQAWEDTLGREAQGLDLTDPEDRVDFRLRVKHATENLNADGHRRLAAHFGVKPAQSKEGTARRIADAWIERQSSPSAAVRPRLRMASSIEEAARAMMEAPARQDPERFATEGEQGVANWRTAFRGRVENDRARLQAYDEAQAANETSPAWLASVERWGDVPIIPIREGAKPDKNQFIVQEDESAAGRYLKGNEAILVFQPTEAKGRPDGQRPAALPFEFGTPALIRHEYGHHVWEKLSQQQRDEFNLLLPRPETPGDVTERDSISYYAALAPGMLGGGTDGQGGALRVDQEAFAELFALATQPGVDLSNYPPGVQDAVEWLRLIIGVPPERDPLHSLFFTAGDEDDPAFDEAVSGLNELIGTVAIPGLEPIPMGTLPRDRIPEHYRASEAMYLHDDDTGKPIAITLTLEAEGPRGQYVVHEIGHHLDHTVLLGHVGAPNEFASDNRTGSFAALAQEMEATAHVQSLINAPNMVDPIHEVQIATFVAYLLRPDELWARAFEQWSALRSGRAEWLTPINESLVEAESLRVNLDGRWPWDEFADIATIIDMIFERRGMLRPGVAGADPAGVMKRGE